MLWDRLLHLFLLTICMDGDAIESIVAALPSDDPQLATQFINDCVDVFEGLANSTLEGIDIDGSFKALTVSSGPVSIFTAFAELPGGEVKKDEGVSDVEKQPTIREAKAQSIWVGAGPKSTLTRHRFMSMVRANIGKRPGGNFEDSVLYQSKRDGYLEWTRVCSFIFENVVLRCICYS